MSKLVVPWYFEFGLELGPVLCPKFKMSIELTPWPLTTWMQTLLQSYLQ